MTAPASPPLTLEEIAATERNAPGSSMPAVWKETILALVAEVRSSRLAASLPTSDEIAELRRLHEEATPAPWHTLAALFGHEGRDAECLVAARNALPRLLLAAERAEGLARAAEGLLDHMHECGVGVDCMITTHEERAAITAARAALAAYRGSAGGGTT